MAKVIMTCGKICCGKTTYARCLQAAGNAVILSIDEITLSLFPEGAGEMHDTYAPTPPMPSMLPPTSITVTIPHMKGTKPLARLGT